MKTIVLTFLVLVFVGCSKDENQDSKDPAKGPNPVEIPIQMGWFSINSGSFIISEDGSSLNNLDYYVLQKSLPQVNFELMGLYVYVPTDKGYTTTISKARVEMTSTTGMATGNIYADSFSFYEGKQMMNGIEYAVYAVFGRYNHEKGIIHPQNFANVTWSLKVDYKKEGQAAGSRDLILSVYKRNE
ncbi:MULTISPECIES: hypothetical protein [unclassified Myroides]|uniref:hypothetical protein n=1 Tax=unclassified Myroides TaxID=2642485 RepID=UPI003D2F8767